MAKLKNINFKKLAVLAVGVFAVSEFTKAQAQNRSAKVNIESNIDFEKWVERVKSDVVLRSKLQGIQGEQGIQGIQGIQGEKGDTGNDGSQFPVAVKRFTFTANTLAEYTQTRTFTHGFGLSNPENVKVEVRALSVVGGNGFNGNFISWNAVLNKTANSLQVRLNSSSLPPEYAGTYEVIKSAGGSEVDFKGDKGDKGDQGIQGEQGIQGIQGIQGEKGDTGNDGSQFPVAVASQIETVSGTWGGNRTITHNLGLANPENVIVQCIGKSLAGGASFNGLLVNSFSIISYASNSLVVKFNSSSLPPEWVGTYEFKVMAGGSAVDFKGDKGDAGTNGTDASVLPSLYYSEVAPLAANTPRVITHNLGLTNPENVVIQLIRDSDKEHIYYFKATEFTANSLKITLPTGSTSGGHKVKILAGASHTDLKGEQGIQGVAGNDGQNAKIYHAQGVVFNEGDVKRIFHNLNITTGGGRGIIVQVLDEHSNFQNPIVPIWLDEHTANYVDVWIDDDYTIPTGTGNFTVTIMGV